MLLSFRRLLLKAFMVVLPPMVQAQCNEYDLMLLCDSADMVDIAVTSIGLDCAFKPTPDACFSSAAVLALPTMSTGCIDCFAGQANCALDNCSTICAFGSAAAYDVCITENCQVAFET